LTRTRRRIAVVPVYNEEATVSSVLSEVYGYVDEVVVVNDGSTDASATELAAWMNGRERATLITLERNRGVSAAYGAAVSVLTERLQSGELGADDLVFTIDADGQHDLSILDQLQQVAEEDSLDALVACRNLAYQSRVKRAGNRVMSRWASVWAGQRLRDVECGYRIIRLGPLIHAMQYMRGYRYSQPAQLAVVMSRLGYRIRNDVVVQVPVDRSRTGFSNAIMHVIAIPWSAARVALAQVMFGDLRSTPRHLTAQIIHLVAAAMAAAAAFRIISSTDGLMSAVPFALAVGGFALARRTATGPVVQGIALVLAPIELLLAGVLWERSSVTVLAAFGAGLTAGLILAPVASPIKRGRPLGPMIVMGAVIVWIVAITWSGANDPAAAWFGQGTIVHGDRNSNMVALTFDDGPNDSTTVALANLLQARGVRGSFFMVGSAVVSRPDIVRKLVAQGEVVGNHSYRHGANDWLALSYQELQRGQDAFAQVLGKCPAFFRPPHGRHSPPMAEEVERLSMHMINWDVSAHDWDSNDPAQIAKKVLAGVQPGSIVLLHDGSNGHPLIDRSVMLKAVPLILDGLDARGLRAVGLDELLGQSAWLPACP
jgi:peptidoglycan/xylan/chitin deacetylase (PgdA/CDA1 family)